MLIHFTPKFFTCPISGPFCEILDIEVPELGLSLKGGEDVVTRRPFPNKRFQVGCRNVGAKAITGILVKTDQHVPRYTVKTRWVINGTFVVSHSVKHEVLDHQYDATTDNMLLWGRTGEHQGGYKLRWPASPDWTPANAQPRMELSRDTARKGIIEDTISEGIIVERKETLELLTVEASRLTGGFPFSERMPSIDDAYSASLAAKSA